MRKALPQSPSPATRANPISFQIATVLGAYLLFLVQPLIAKQILPWFGGAPAVWSTCLVFFQLALVAGYGYAHLTRWLGVRRQIALHAVLLVLTFLTLPISASEAWKPVDASAPVRRLLILLTLGVGAPYAMLATTAPLLQDWSRRVMPAGTPHRLYAWSNVGSLAALASYPVVVERTLSLHAQSLWWSTGFAVFAAACGWCAWQALQARPATDPTPDAPAGSIGVASGLDPWLWVVLAACGSGLLLAVTNQLCQDVAVVPLLWIVPMALYLLTFIICFAGGYSRRWWIGAFAVGFAATTYALGHATSAPLVLQAGALLLSLTAGCMLCHGELVRIRPRAERLTAFYLAMAVGGSLGGMFVALAAPRLFVTYLELPLLLLAVPALVLLAWFRDLAVRQRTAAPVWAAVVPLAAFGVAGFLVLGMATPAGAIASVRNFYGRLLVVDDGRSSPPRIRRLFHGRVLHGAQFIDPVARRTPTTYFAAGSGIDMAVRQHGRRLRGEPLTVGVVGLGAGTIAAWGERGDRFRFFELDPDVVEFARRYFTFLADSPAGVDVVVGDGRLSLEREMAFEPRRHTYDVLAVDAFSGDSIPVHLLTRECFLIYQRALRPDGVLAFHVSNHYLDLRPVVRGLAGEFGLQALEVDRAAQEADGAWSSVWMLVSADEGFLRRAGALARPEPASAAGIVWTDSFSSLIPVLKRP